MVQRRGKGPLRARREFSKALFPPTIQTVVERLRCERVPSLLGCSKQSGRVCHGLFDGELDSTVRDAQPLGS